MKLGSAKKARLTANDTIILLAAEPFDAEKIPDEIQQIIAKADLSHFRGKTQEIISVSLKSEPTVIIAGYGKDDEADEEAIRNASSSAIKTAIKLRKKNIQAYPPISRTISEEQMIGAIAEGCYLSNYSFSKYKSDPENSAKIDGLTIVSSFTGIAPILRQKEIICENVLLCRDLVNETSDIANPSGIAARAKKIGSMKKVSHTMLDRKKIERLGMGLLSAVGRGGINGPYLVILSYKGNPSSREMVALIGKGITFDSGGLNLKQSGHIEEMRSDMAGAAAMMYTLKSAAE
ncbi:MAG TPA: M17 family peptidase N-terminal domain-containing protein, partial [Spirochaetota bacterium]